MASKDDKSDHSSSEEDDVMMDDIHDVEDAISKFEKIRVPDVKRGMFVSGWDDPDDLVEEDKDPEASDDRLILYAAEKGDLPIVRSILQRNPDAVKARDKDGYTPLHRAAYENHPEVVELLLYYKADINAKTEFGWTPLHSACKWNHPDMVALLLQHEADVNALTDGSQTPLHIAATVSDCRETMVALLMDERVRPELVNNSEETAFAIARRTGTTYPVFDMFKPGIRVETGLID